MDNILNKFFFDLFKILKLKFIFSYNLDKLIKDLIIFFYKYRLLFFTKKVIKIQFKMSKLLLKLKNKFSTKT